VGELIKFGSVEIYAIAFDVLPAKKRSLAGQANSHAGDADEPFDQP
jgi:hypothetical protein